MKTITKFLSVLGMTVVATPTFAHIVGEGSGVGMWNGYHNIATGFTVILIWIVLLLLIGVLWKTLHH